MGNMKVIADDEHRLLVGDILVNMQLRWKVERSWKLREPSTSQEFAWVVAESKNEVAA